MNSFTAGRHAERAPADGDAVAVSQDGSATAWEGDA